jgi:hypothetical protein
MSLKQCMHLVLATVILLRCLVWSGAFGYVPPPGEMLGSSTSGGAPARMPRSAKMARAESAAQAAGGPQSRTSTRYSQVIAYTVFLCGFVFIGHGCSVRGAGTPRHERKPITHTRRREITEIRSRTAPADAPADTPADALHLHVVPLLVMAVLLRWAC